MEQSLLKPVNIASLQTVITARRFEIGDRHRSWRGGADNATAERPARRRINSYEIAVCGCLYLHQSGQSYNFY